MQALYDQHQGRDDLHDLSVRETLHVCRQIWKIYVYVYIHIYVHVYTLICMLMHTWFLLRHAAWFLESTGAGLRAGLERSSPVHQPGSPEDRHRSGFRALARRPVSHFLLGAVEVIMSVMTRLDSVLLLFSGLCVASVGFRQDLWRVHWLNYEGYKVLLRDG